MYTLCIKIQSLVSKVLKQFAKKYLMARSTHILPCNIKNTISTKLASSSLNVPKLDASIREANVWEELQILLF